MTPVLLGVLGYVLAQLLIGAAVSRRIATESDYLLAGRRLGYTLASFSIFATWFGAETCMGAAGEVYANGLSLRTPEPFAYAACLLLMGLVFAGPLWRRKLTTLADLFRQRFSGGVERYAALLMIPTSLLWAAAQIRAFGQVLSSASQMEIEAAMALAAAVVVAYTVSGGLLADAITDLVQGIALVIGLGILAVAVLGAAGGFGPAWAAIQGGELRASATAGGWVATIEAWSIPIFGSVVAQELVARVSAARSREVARRSSLAAGAAYLAIGLAPITIGLLGAGLLPGLEVPDQVLPELAQRHLSPFLFVVFAGALVSAILSTVDSTLLVASSLAAHNLVVPLLRSPSEALKVRLARGGVVLFGLVAYALARTAEGVMDLVESASALGSSGLLVIVVLGLFTRFGGPASAFASLTAGLATYLFGVSAGWEIVYLPSLAAALGLYVAVALGSGKARTTAEGPSSGDPEGRAASRR